MNDEFKTTVITFDKNEDNSVVEQEQKAEQQEKAAVQNLLFNITTKVPHVEESLPTTKVELPTKKIDLKPVEKVNANAKFLPSFYKQELRRFFRLFITWICIFLGCLGLEIWAIVAIAKNTNVSNWAMLTMIPPFVLTLGFLIVYGNNYKNFKAEANNVDFSKEKVVTNNVSKLYKRLKTAHINVNWMCLLTYVGGGLAILIDYIIAWAISRTWGNLSPELLNGNPAFLITLIVCSAAMILAFILHVTLLVTNYVRAGKIDAFYAVQIVSDDELTLLKKQKNKRDAIIFAAVILLIALIGWLIYRLVKNKKVQNNVTITNK